MISRRRWVAAAVAVMAAGVSWWLLAALPVVAFDAPLSTVLFDRNGKLLGGVVASDGQWRFGLPAQVPARYRRALLAYEDARFDRHLGVDPLAVARAAWTNLRRGHVQSGASTLTMQVVRLAHTHEERTLREKIVEAALAVRLEMALPKREILKLYAAYAPYGGNTVGIDAASWRYFGRAPQDLSWAEAATLAVLPNSPGLIHPSRNRDRLKQKRDGLLARLRARGDVTEETLRLAQAEPLPDQPRPLPNLAPHLVFSQRKRAQGSVRTHIDQDLQRRSLDLLQSHQGTLRASGIHNAAVVIIDNAHARMIVHHGNVFFDGKHGDHIDMTLAARSTGSLLKPFVFYGLLARGEWLPDQLIADVPVRLAGFSPENFGKTFDGAVPASRALARSLNIPAVLALQAYGVPSLVADLRSLGMTTLTRNIDSYGLPLALGGGEGRLLELAALYASLARAAAGMPKPVVSPAALVHGDKIATRSSLDAAAAYLTLEALLQTERPGVDAAWGEVAGPHAVAWKTGTSQGHRDAWSIGVTAGHTVAVWVGNADGHGRSGLTGKQAAAPLMFALFDLLPRQAWFSPPTTLQPLTVCAHSGMKASEACPQTAQRLVAPAAMQAAPCRHCRWVHLDAVKDERVHADCAAVATMRSVRWFNLPPDQELHYRRKHPQHQPLPPWKKGCVPDEIEGTATMTLMRPQEGARVTIPVGLDGQPGRTVLVAAHQDHTARIHWHLDGHFLGTTDRFHQMEVAPHAGNHMLVLVDEAGARVERRFAVLGRR